MTSGHCSVCFPGLVLFPAVVPQINSGLVIYIWKLDDMLDCYFSIDSVPLIHLEIVCLLQIGTACLETFGVPLSASQRETQKIGKDI